MNYLCAQQTKRTMLHVILSVGLYAAAIVLLVKSAIAFCDQSHNDIVTKP